MTTTSVRPLDSANHAALDDSGSRKAARVAAVSLAGAAALFWSAWLFMPVAGVTDTYEIFALVTPRRGATMAAAVLQLVAATLFVPAMIGLIRSVRLPFHDRIWRPAAVLVVGLLGLAADALDHMLAYAMTAPGVNQAEQVETMQFMQGPALMIIGPLLACFVVGGIWLSVAFARAGAVSRWNPGLHVSAVVVGALGALVAQNTALDGRYVGIAALGLFAAALAWLGAVMWRLRDS